MSIPVMRLTYRLWFLLLVGSLLLAFGIAKASMAFDDIYSYLIYRAVFTVSCFCAAWPVMKFCRWLWHFNLNAWRTGLIAACTAYVFGMLCSLCALLAQVAFGDDLYMRKFEWTHAFNGAYFAWFVLCAVCAAYFGLRQYQALQQERHRLFVANALAREAELRALRYQLQPHFLFNTLNAISTLVREGDSRSATRMITRLAEFLRATLEGNGAHEVTLEEEVALTRHYLEIEKVRFGTRLDIDLQIDVDALRLRVPNLLLQPLVENAIRHGIAPSTHGGKITIRAQRDHDMLCILIIDNGLGYSQHDATRLGETKVGIGLENTRARLDRLYPQRHRLEISYPEIGGCIVSIELPCDAHLPADHELPQIENA
ncbi:sensor histidine kinase [Pseudolysobacter antarcticus]|nr:sensor histidine kinase [Pseudolysobacter antarcticus]